MPGTNMVTYPDATAIGDGNANKTQLLEANPDREQVILSPLESNDQNLRWGDENVDTDQGVQMIAGQTYAICMKGPVYVCGEAAGTLACGYQEILE